MINPKRGMLLLNKSAGLTSFQSLFACKRSFATKKIGHAGTLDKFAEGLLLVLVNEATRLVPFFVGMDKTYIADIHFGQETDTLDPGGAVVRHADVPNLDQIKASLGNFIGSIQQIPPSYSAIHINGKRAYERVLAGEDPEIPSRLVEISKLEILDWTSPVLRVRVDCSSGTYIRSLARDIANACQSAAFLGGLNRTRIGPFHLNQAVLAPDKPIDAAWAEAGWLEGRAMAESIANCRVLELKPEYQSAFQSGKTIQTDWFLPNSIEVIAEVDCVYSICCFNLFLGMVELKNRNWSYRLVFPA